MYFFLLLMGSALFFGSYARTIEKTVSIRIIEERVDGRLFTQRSDMIDGVLKQFWHIDGAQVDERDFDEEILEAEKSERRKERREQKQQQRLQQQKQLQMQRAGVEKLFTLVSVQIERSLQRLADSRLQPYLLFNPATISQSDILEMLHHKIAEGRQLVGSEVGQDMVTIKQITSFLEPFVVKLEAVYSDTLTHAINQCDDTKVLKGLLELAA